MLYELFLPLFIISFAVMVIFFAMAKLKNQAGLSEITLGLIDTVLFMILASGSFIITINGVDYLLDWIPPLCLGIGVVMGIYTFALVYEFVLQLLKVNRR